MILYRIRMILGRSLLILERMLLISDWDSDDPGMDFCDSGLVSDDFT